MNWEKLSRSLLQYRNTPCRKDGLSPAQKLFGHPVQDSLPAHRRSFAPEWQKSLEEADKDASASRHMAEQAYNQHTRELPDIKVGSHVAIQNPRLKLWDIYGVVTALASHRRYIVKATSGRVFVVFSVSESQYRLEHENNTTQHKSPKQNQYKRTQTLSEM